MKHPTVLKQNRTGGSITFRINLSIAPNCAYTLYITLPRFLTLDHLPSYPDLPEWRILQSPLLHMELLFRHSTMIISQTTGRPGGLGDAVRNWIESRDLFIWVSLCNFKKSWYRLCMNEYQKKCIWYWLCYDIISIYIVVYNWQSQYQPGDDLFMLPITVTNGNLRHAFPICKEVHGTVQYSN